MLVYIAFAIALFFAMNIGASGAAAAMGVSYGSGAIKHRKVALVICALGILLGAVIGGGEVVKTIGSGIIPESILTVELVIIILASATLSLFFANLIGIPLSTSEVTVGSVVGVGIAYQSVYIQKLLIVMSFWVIVPIISFVIAFVCGWLLKKKKTPTQQKWKKPLAVLVIATGFFEAFSAGMNNVANAVGPLVGAGMISTSTGVIAGGLAVAVGALLLGDRVIETNGKKITDFTVGEGCIISGTGASLVTAASVFGLPVPLTQVTTSSIIGIGAAKSGFTSDQRQVIVQMLKVWVVSPVFSLVISYGLVKLVVETDFYAFVVLISGCIATYGILSLIKTTKQKQENQKMTA
ncbi:sulfate permease [Bacillus sp. VT 712]|uniref:Sulfate permease n=2 Tax=Priestia TaxID=2800373 RepID=A0A0V8JK98_9BACI|nr:MULTISPECIES: inorganic phosphate transporter [Bacillaceae]KSU87401.1 sulfate permease [Priestia veravalensis]KZB91112.1 sulfate permease [Bacillus sp. VT 712]MDW8517827.1 inorganic phosphate transporter [Priestia flexa]QCS51591.1 inorganic phosphate transporter [Priestia flexa]WEZ09167.1 inorganic phosphate transporter [Priestia flexa]